MMDDNNFEVIIVGGSYAGLSAAMALGRSLRKTLVIDGGRPCNATTPHSHNFLTQDGRTPSEISAVARQQVERYTSVRFHDDLVVSGAGTTDGFELTTQSGRRFSARKLVFATGITDLLPDIDGFAACWGKSVIHCPYCHGYEYHSQKTGLMANGEAAMHLASLINNLTTDLTILTNGPAEFTEEQHEKLRQHGIPVIETEIARLEHEHGQLQQVIFTDGEKLTLDALYAKVPFVQHTDVPASLGCELTEHGHLKVDPLQMTTVPGIFVCGDNAFGMRSVANAVAAGNLTGAMVNKVLVDEGW